MRRRVEELDNVRLQLLAQLEQADDHPLCENDKSFKPAYIMCVPSLSW
jgi:hypothetical protein